MRKFEITDEEEKKLEKWDKKHKKKCKFFLNNRPATGDRLKFSFEPTGLGTISIVERTCGAKCDLTDSSKW